MPIYEYRCQSCGKELEATQRIVDAPLKECPSCHQQTLERLISATSFQLKGSGWYKDGYGGKKARSDSAVADRLDKAIKDDKVKTESASATESSSSGAASPAATTSSSSGSGSSGGSGGSGSSGGASGGTSGGGST